MGLGEAELSQFLRELHFIEASPSRLFGLDATSQVLRELLFSEA